MRAIREVPNEWTRVLAPDASPDCSDFLLRHQPEGSRARQILVDKDSRCTQFIHSLSTSSILCRELPSNLNIRAFTDQCPLVERGAQATATKQKDRRVQIFCLRESAITVYAIQHSRDFCRFDSTSRSRRYEVLIRFALKEDEPTIIIPTEQPLRTRLAMSEKTTSADEPEVTQETEPEKKTIAAARTTKTRKSSARKATKRKTAKRKAPKKTAAKRKVPKKKAAKRKTA